MWWNWKFKGFVFQDYWCFHLVILKNLCWTGSRHPCAGYDVETAKLCRWKHGLLKYGVDLSRRPTVAVPSYVCWDMTWSGVNQVLKLSADWKNVGLIKCWTRGWYTLVLIFNLFMNLSVRFFYLFWLRAV